MRFVGLFWFLYFVSEGLPHRYNSNNGKSETDR